MTPGTRRRRWAAVGLGAALIATGASLQGPAHAVSERSLRTYVGLASAGTASEIRLNVDVRRGKPRSATFEATDINLACEDGTTRDWTPGFDPIKLGFHGSRRTFDGRRYEQGQPTGPEIFARVHGRLLSGGRAEGYLLLYLNPYDPPGQTNDPECTTTRGQQTWSAERE
jgi:hypothetical protein